MDHANAVEWAQRAVLEYKGLVLGRLSQTSSFQTNNEDSSVYAFTFASWETPAVLEKMTKLTGCHTPAGWKEVIMTTVIFSLCSPSSYSRVVCCVSAHRCWYLVHAANVPPTHPQRACRRASSSGLAPLLWAVPSYPNSSRTEPFQLSLMNIFWGCMLQCGVRMSKYSASCSSFGIFTFLHFLGYFEWLMNSVESIYTYRWALVYKSLLCTHVSQ